MFRIFIRFKFTCFRRIRFFKLKGFSKGALNLSKIKKCTYGLTDGVLSAVLGTVFRKFRPGFFRAASIQPLKLNLLKTAP